MNGEHRHQSGSNQRHHADGDDPKQAAAAGDRHRCDGAQRGERPGSYGERVVEASREVHDDYLGEDRPEARI